MARMVVVGAGIVGLAVAARLAGRGDDVTVVEKEAVPAAHQTGRNSGVIHSGLYYAPGSLKARMCVAGAASMTAFARAHDVPVQICGKLVVAIDNRDVPQLHMLADRAASNGVPARLLTPLEARQYEPAVDCVAALRVETTGIVDYRGVCRALVGQIADAGGRIEYGRRFVGAWPVPPTRSLRVGLGGTAGTKPDADLEADGLVVCGGLHSDRLARACGLDPQARIVPFRGEYFELSDRAAALVRGLIYPVPDPRFPFLGVHLTRMVGGGVHAGPNAVLALAREGYTWGTVRAADLADSLSWPGLWRLGAHNVMPGAREVARSVSRRLFARSLARLVPGVQASDLRPSPAGVRAQALRRDGRLVDDFLLQTAPRQVHVINAPSPAATASLEIAEHVVGQLDQTMQAA